MPAPVYIVDQVRGTLSGSTLYLDRDAPADSNPIRGEFVIRYAIPVLVPPGISLIPGLFVSERGEMLTGREAWDYLQKRFQLHPRADVIGSLPDGVPLQLLVRALDFGASMQAFIYRDPLPAAPLAALSLIVASDEMYAGLPDLLRRYVPRG